jgi:iron complex outermembrane recepter protein
MLFIFNAGAAGAENNQSDLKKTREKYELGAITVTAEKREENMQEVPVSITALPETQIEDAGIVSLFELANNIPNMDVNPVGGSRYYTTTSIRGIGTTFLGDPAVGLYVDDVPYSDEHSYNIQLFDIERIEVLRGPQGVLYGKNSQGGVINIVTRKPGNDFSGRASVGLGNYNSQEYRAAVSGPIIENQLFFRISGVKTSRDGFVDNTFLASEPDDRSGASGRVGLRWIPDEKTEVSFSANYEENDDGSMIMVPMDQENPFEVSWDYDGHEDSRFNGQSLKVAHEFSLLKLVSVTARREWVVDDFLIDYDYSPYDVMIGGMKKDNTQWSQEFRFHSLENGGPLKWLAGAYYGHKDYDSELPYVYGTAASAYGIAQGTEENQVAEMTHQDYALFGQTTYTVFEKLDLMAGIRFSFEEKTMDRTHYFDISGSRLLVVPDMSFENSWNEWTPKVNASYRFSEHFMAYAGVAKGYKSGGFSYSEDDISLVEFDPEKSWNYETGIKSSWLDRRLIVNAALFYNNIDDMQVRQQTGTNTVTVLNAKEATTKGFELEIMAEPLPGLHLAGGMGYTDSEYTDFVDPVTNAEYEGNHFLGVPLYNYNLSAQYRHRTGFMARIELQGISERYFDAANSKKESYELVNGRIGYEGERFDIYLWAKNLFDKEYFTMGWGETGGADLWTGSPGDPLTIGVQLTVRL